MMRKKRHPKVINISTVDEYYAERFGEALAEATEQSFIPVEENEMDNFQGVIIHVNAPKLPLSLRIETSTRNAVLILLIVFGYLENETLFEFLKQIIA